MKKVFLSGIAILLSISLIGCSTGEENGQEQRKPSTEENLQKGKYGAVQKNGNTFDITITNEEYLDAVNDLGKDRKISDTLMKYIHLQQLKINEDFYIVWTEHSIPDTDLPILVVFNGEKKPVYAEAFRERIESVRYIGQNVFDKGLLEVVSYGASGSFSGQWVNLMMLEQDAVHDVWEYQTISNASRFNEEKAVMEYLHQYSSYLILPEYQQRFPEHGAPKIIVHDTSEIILVSGEEQVLSRDRQTKQISFIWDAEQVKFVEEK